MLLSLTSHFGVFEWGKNAAVLSALVLSNILAVAKLLRGHATYLYASDEGRHPVNPQTQAQQSHLSIWTWTSLTTNMIHSLLSQDQFKDAAALTARHVCHLLHASHPEKCCRTWKRQRIYKAGVFTCVGVFHNIRGAQFLAFRWSTRTYVLKGAVGI